MAGEKEVKLIGSWASLYGLRVSVALNLKSVDYEFLQEKIGTKSDLLLKSNPVYKKIPVLLHNGRPICESLIIVQYIDETWTSGPSILPSDPYDRAIARFWGTYIDDKFFPSVTGITMAQGEEAKAEAVAQTMGSLELLEKAFGECSKGKGFFGGERIGYLDLALGSYVAVIRVAETIGEVKLLDEVKFPGLVSWAERFSTHEAVKDVIPEHDKLLDLAKQFQSMRTAAPPSPN